MGSGPSFPVVSLTKDRTIVVTGANCGIGYEIAKHCAIMGATVILACRSEERARNAMRRMEEEFYSEVVTAESSANKFAIEFMQVDLGSFQSVMNFCEEFKKSGRPLNVLFCNAGIGLGPYAKTKDGLEQQLQVNYLSHFLMITKLLSVMKQSGPDCRILMTSSAAHAAANIDVANMNYDGNENDFGLWDYYGRSKAYQIIQTYCMARRLKDSNISVNCFHPGFVKTELFNYTQNCCLKCCCSCLLGGGCARTPIKGATCGIDLAVNPKHSGVTGNYWVDCRIAAPKPFTRDEQLQEAIWRESFKFLKDYLTGEEISMMEGK